MKGLIAGAALAALMTAASPVDAQQHYPERPIRLIVGQSPGSAADGVARLLAAEMGKYLGQSVVVENQAGAGGTIAAASVAQMKPDGYTLMMGIASQLSLGPHLFKKAAYDPFKDFTYIAPAADVVMVLTASDKSGVTDLATLVRKAKAAPGRMTYASSGVGSASQLSVEMLSERAGISLLHVPYKGTAPAVTSVIANETDLLSNVVGAVYGPARSGKLVPIVVFADKRSALLPDVPTSSEQGYELPKIAGWVGLVGPAGLPAEIAVKLADALHRAQQDPKVQAFYDAQGLILWQGNAAEFLSRARTDSDVWGKLIREKGIVAE
ncbi:hypothetical protein CAL26_05535 [Bordetella genomosp. 9]|uniref:ABC transporter substrate-binding protein n=1 Tax=Bordetella genomosp. 9 TaxID=1416803 RepID=A0A261RQ32_9BORD|nr:tripartite tricarboxylate transporter substrate binding protein [Bordetella genomosp. 9]OZI26782.1 hypothetical protein CAL26_05535 [Bordetella genomosp. 9]